MYTNSTLSGFLFFVANFNFLKYVVLFLERERGVIVASELFGLFDFSLL